MLNELYEKLNEVEKYSSEYWRDRLLGRVTRGRMDDIGKWREEILQSFAEKEIEPSEEFVHMANEFFIHRSMTGYGKQKTFEETIEELKGYAKSYGFSIPEIKLITLADLEAAKVGKLD